MGFVPQDIFLFSETIKENIAFGERTLPIEDIQIVASLSDIHKFVEEELLEKYCNHNPVPYKQFSDIICYISQGTFSEHNIKTLARHYSAVASDDIDPPLFTTHFKDADWIENVEIIVDYVIESMPNNGTDDMEQAMHYMNIPNCSTPRGVE